MTRSKEIPVNITIIPVNHQGQKQFSVNYVRTFPKNTSVRMSFSSRYMKIPLFFLYYCGLWLQTNAKLQVPYRIFFVFVFVSSLILQLCGLIKSTNDVAEFLETFYLFLILLAATIKYILFLMNRDKLKAILDAVDCMWMNTSKEELVMVQRSAEKCTKLMNVLMAYSIVPAVYVGIGYIPDVLDLVMPLNESRSREFPVNIKLYVTDQENHFHLMLGIINCIIVMVCFTAIVIDVVNMALWQQICVFYELAAHRVGCGIERTIESNCGTFAQIYRVLSSGIQLHHFAIRMTESLRQCCSTMYFIMLGIAIVVCSMSIYSILICEELVKRICFGALAISSLSYNFCIHLSLQELYDTINNFQDKIYFTRWYNSSLFAKKVLLVMLQAKLTKFPFTCVIYVPSFEGFTKVVNLIMSYFMFLKTAM